MRYVPALSFLFAVAGVAQEPPEVPEWLSRLRQALAGRADVRFVNADARTVLDQIARAAGVAILRDPEFDRIDLRVDMVAVDVSLHSVLSRTLRGTEWVAVPQERGWRIRHADRLDRESREAVRREAERWEEIARTTWRVKLTEALQKRVSLELDEVSPTAALDRLAGKVEFNRRLSPGLAQRQELITLRATDVPAMQVLQRIAELMGGKVELLDEMVCLEPKPARAVLVSVQPAIVEPLTRVPELPPIPPVRGGETNRVGAPSKEETRNPVRGGETGVSVPPDQPKVAPEPPVRGGETGATVAPKVEPSPGLEGWVELSEAERSVMTVLELAAARCGVAMSVEPALQQRLAPLRGRFGCGGVRLRQLLDFLAFAHNFAWQAEPTGAIRLTGR